MNRNTDIDIILPCYNPPPGWEQKVIRKFKDIQNLFHPISFHLFIVSDGSECGYEPEIIATLKQEIPGIRLIDYHPNKGKGYALREAVRHTRSEYFIYTDYDFPYTDDSFRQVIDSLLKGADVVVTIRDKNYLKILPPFRRFLSKSSHLCNVIFLRLKVHDTQGGLKGFNKAGKTIFLSTKINRFLFDTEFIYKSQKKEMNIKAIQSSIREDLTVSEMNFKVLVCEMINFLSILFSK